MLYHKASFVCRLECKQSTLLIWCLVPDRMLVTTVLDRGQYTNKVTEFTTRVAALSPKHILPPTNVTETVSRHRTAMGRWRYYKRKGWRPSNRIDEAKERINFWERWNWNSWIECNQFWCFLLINKSSTRLDWNEMGKMEEYCDSPFIFDTVVSFTRNEPNKCRRSWSLRHRNLREREFRREEIGKGKRKRYEGKQT
jgi:hypothetical protein